MRSLDVVETPGKKSKEEALYRHKPEGKARMAWYDKPSLLQRTGYQQEQGGPLRRERATLLFKQRRPLHNPRIRHAFRLRVFRGINHQHLTDALRALFL